MSAISDLNKNFICLNLTIIVIKTRIGVPKFIQIEKLILKSHFEIGGCPPPWIFEICFFGHVACSNAILLPPPIFALIVQYGAEI